MTICPRCGRGERIIKKDSNKPVIQNSITKALLTKEAIASCELDGETQTGDMTIEPKAELNKHHMFKYVEIKDRLIDIFGKPTTEEEKAKFDNLCWDTWNKIPKFKIAVEKHRSIHKAERDRVGEYKKVWFEHVHKKAKQQGISQRTQDILDIMNKCEALGDRKIVQEKYDMDGDLVDLFISHQYLKSQIKSLDSPQTKPAKDNNRNTAEISVPRLNKTEDTIQSKKEKK